MAKQNKRQASSPALPAARLTRAAAAAAAVDREATDAPQATKGARGRQATRFAEEEGESNVERGRTAGGKKKGGRKRVATPGPAPVDEEDEAPPVRRKSSRPRGGKGHPDVDEDSATPVPKSGRRQKELEELSQDENDDDDSTPLATKRTRKATEKPTRKAAEEEDGGDDATVGAPPPKVLKHRRAAVHGLKARAPRGAEMTVEIPMSAYSTPTARNRPFLQNVGGNDSISGALPPSSPTVGPNASSDDEFPHVDDAEGADRGAAQRDPSPMFNLNLVQRARARAQAQLDKERAEANTPEEPQQDEESDDGDGGSNYSEGVKARNAKDLKALKNGEEVYRTEDEDNEDDEEFHREISKAQKTYKGKRSTASDSVVGVSEAHAPLPPAAKGQQGGSKEAHNKKSKQRRATPLEDDLDVLEDAEDDDDGDWAKVPGPLSKDAKEEARELGRKLNLEVTALARKYGKDRKAVMRYTGVTLQATRGPNPFNKYSTWYKHQFPMQQGDDDKRYKREILQKYRALIAGLEGAEREKALQPMMDWVNDLQNGRVEGTDARRSVSSMMQAGMEQLEDLCRVYETHDITILGAIISTSRDPAARQMSKIFGTDQAVVELVAANEINLNLLLDRVQNCIICQNYSMEGAELPLPKDLLGSEGGGKDKGKGKEREKDNADGKRRDTFRGTVKYKMLARIQAHVPSQKSVPWAYWANFAFANQVAIEGWPTGILPPGGQGFNFKNLSTGELETLDSALDDGSLRIVAWNSDDMKLAELKDKSVARVGLVIDTEGRLVRRVIDSTTYSEAAKKRKAGDTDNVDEDSRPVLPLPRRGGGSDGNPAPLKRKRMEEDVAPVRPSVQPSNQGRAHTTQRAHAPPSAATAVAPSEGVDRARPAPPQHRQGDDPLPKPRMEVTSRDRQIHRVEDSMGRPPNARPRAPPPSEYRAATRMLPGPGISGEESSRPPRSDLNIDEGVRVNGVALKERRELRRKTMEDMDGFIESYGQASPPRRARRVSQQSRQRSVGLADSDADLPEGPGEMRRSGGFTDAYGRYFVRAPAPVRRTAGEFAQQQREAGGSRRRVSAPSRRPEPHVSAQAGPGPSSLAGGSRQRSQSGGLQPIREYERYRRRDGPYDDEDIDDDMDLAPDVPRQWDYAYEDDDMYTQ
ncbi:hypothetical protein PLICRDRAFT_180202 [Plicaturopsis crispa FD-325 SS-3]|uniref:Uncharacterized protein n=1 Tax=Plicaturopsis crispa FD-325 SS-3 TaxID=944288 RepID=A0A0C9SWA7_PLICR|nr:hypothetical protein PLICRDRAFT_180202 [Plicaturopsis crispa FD-325 SS-3]